MEDVTKRLHVSPATLYRYLPAERSTFTRKVPVTVQLDLFPTDLRLRCIDQASNKRQFYALSVERTLFGEWALVREWGRIGVSCRLRRDLSRLRICD